jgi:SpoVK/Ycf46/Vps4 family AAA+-type ATPase
MQKRAARAHHQEIDVGATLAVVSLPVELSTRLGAVADRVRAGESCTVLLFAGAGDAATNAAAVIAGALGRDLHRIDLSAVVTKYIGETEKNLRRVFDAAETADVVLFFDEADALFGKRSEVKDSHDRYANIEINYLLDRIEAHPGLIVVASNARDRVPDRLRRHACDEVPLG